MKRIFHFFFSACLFLSFLTACAYGVNEQNVDSQIVEITTPSVFPQSSKTIASKDLPLSNCDELCFDTGYYSGVIVITRYYTYLDQGSYIDAYNLLGSNAKRHSPSIQEYVWAFSINFKTVEIISILPAYVVAKNNGSLMSPEPNGKKTFMVQIRSWGEGNMSGSVPNGVLQSLILTVVFENDAWKIDSFG